MNKASYGEALDKLKEINHELQVQYKERMKTRTLKNFPSVSGETIFEHIIRIKHSDGTALIYESASAFRWRGWFLIFTEHHGNHAYDFEDAEVQVLKWGYMKSIK